LHTPYTKQFKNVIHSLTTSYDLLTNIFQKTLFSTKSIDLSVTYLWDKPPIHNTHTVDT